MWAPTLGVVAIVFGTLMTAAQGNELLAQTVIGPDTAAARNIPADCRPDEAGFAATAAPGGCCGRRRVVIDRGTPR